VGQFGWDDVIPARASAAEDLRGPQFMSHVGATINKAGKEKMPQRPFVERCIHPFQPPKERHAQIHIATGGKSKQQLVDLGNGEWELELF